MAIKRVTYNTLSSGKFTVTKGLTALTEADFTEITQQEVKAMFA